MNTVATPRLGLGRQTLNFGRHLLEMCAAMCVGAGINVLLFSASSLAGHPGLRERFPELSLLLIAFNIAWPMAVWMRIRRMDWRPTLEMSAATMGLAIALIVLAALDVLPKSVLTIGFCGAACAVMVVVMLCRVDLYTGRADHHMRAARTP